jgi:hypothetical protein
MDGHVLPPQVSASPTRRASLGLEPVFPAATTLYETSIGRRVVPTFFWGETTSPGRLQRLADRLILMGDWRDSDRSQMIEETDAVVELEREQYFEYPYRIISEKFVRLLDTGQLMGDPFNSFNSF